MATSPAIHPIVGARRLDQLTDNMTSRGSGTILTLSTAASRVVLRGTLGYGTTGTVVEVVSERLAVELGPSGVRVVCLRPHAIADGPSRGSFAGAVFESRAAAAGVGVEQWLEQFALDTTVLGQFPTVADIAGAAVFLASDRASAITGTVVDLTFGNAVRTNVGPLARLLG
jgi:NAD(P)-dependent dehydrogenase (short-subunit alcohol dehydrogenase family)